MTLTSPARAAAGSSLRPLPLRHPDVRDARMMNRRGWWLVLLNWLLPDALHANTDMAADTDANTDTNA